MRVAILGGTGVDQTNAFKASSKTVTNEYGTVTYSEHAGVVYLPRHSVGHSVPPHLINYKANIALLKDLGVESVISIYAVGSISDRLKPLEWGVVDDFIDVSGKAETFFTGGEKGVKHIDMSSPFDRTLCDKLLEKDSVKAPLVYITTSGPRLETKAEIRAYRAMGADIVGMTLAKEAVLLAEAGIRNASIAYSINWASGVNESVSFVSDEDVDRLTSHLVEIAREVLL